MQKFQKKAGDDTPCLLAEHDKEISGLVDSEKTMKEHQKSMGERERERERGWWFKRIVDLH